LRKTAPYIILFVIAAAIVGLLLTGNNKREKKFNDRVTLRMRDKIPYGTRIAFESLKHIFPNASISTNKREPGYWDSLSTYGTKQALIIISPSFNADDFDLKKLIRFAEFGNDVFISTRNVSPYAEEIFSIKANPVGKILLVDKDDEPHTDRLYLKLNDPPFSTPGEFSYDGKKFNARLAYYDTTITDVLGMDDFEGVNFVHFRAGEGNIYLHVAPLAFSNYFLLQDNNFKYYENALSVISPEVTKVVWDEYYLNKRGFLDQEQQGSPNWLGVLFRYEGLKWALLLAIFTLALYVLMEMRRRQRVIPVLGIPKNESLDFVKTIGRLYFEKGDHANLCYKMAAYFLEHVRIKYKLSTGMLDNEFVQKLQFKSGCSEKEIKDVVSFINNLRAGGRINEKQVADFHRKLETFYGKTDNR
jgi:hypothetical protein